MTIDRKINFHDQIIISAMSNPEFVKSILNRYGDSPENMTRALRDFRASMERFLPEKL